MCQFRITVPATTAELKEQASARLGALPHVKGVPRAGKGTVSVTIDHPSSLTQLQAAAWAKDMFGMSPVFAPSVAMLTA